jgi:hypothetical protein
MGTAASEWQARRALVRAGLGERDYALGADGAIRLRGDWRLLLQGYAYRLVESGVHVDVYRLQPDNYAVGYRLCLYPPGAVRGVNPIPVTSVAQVPAECR